jgi:parvulin-like peptidyl-prolyl isomerase
MQSVRNFSTKIAAVLFGLLMLLFVVSLSGIFDGGGNTLFTQTAAGSINGRRVDARLYETAVQRNIDAQQQRTPGRMSLEDVQQVRNSVWDQLVNETVLQSQYDKYGITVSEDEVLAAMRTEPLPELRDAAEFQTDSQFDLAKYQRWLASPVAAQMIDGLAAQYESEIRRSKLLAAVTADVYLSDGALWQQYRDQNEQVTVSLTPILPRNAVPDAAVTVTAAEVADYYRQHKDQFSRPRTAFVSYVQLPRLPDATDSAAALARARQVRAEITGGAPFADVARRESSDSVSAASGGDLGEWTRGGMDPAFDKAAFALPLNAISEPVLSAFGYHVIQVSSRSGDKATGRHILIPVEVVGAHRDQLDAAADSLDRVADATDQGATFDQVARALNLTVRPGAPVQQGSRVQAGNLVVPDAGVWAFQSKAGEVSPVIETEYAFFLFRLDSLSEAGTPALDDIRGSVEQAIRDEKKLVKAREIAADYLARVKGGEAMAAAATAMNLPNREMGPFPRVNPPLQNPDVVGAAFGLKEGQVSSVIETDEGLYVMKLVKHVPADSAEFTKKLEEYRRDAVRLARQNRVRNYLAALRDDAKIEDNREALYEQARNQAATLPQQL